MGSLQNSLASLASLGSAGGDTDASGADNCDDADNDSEEEEGNLAWIRTGDEDEPSMRLFSNLKAQMDYSPEFSSSDAAKGQSYSNINMFDKRFVDDMMHENGIEAPLPLMEFPTSPTAQREKETPKTGMVYVQASTTMRGRSSAKKGGAA
jgi:hypothetical protein